MTLAARWKRRNMRTEMRARAGASSADISQRLYGRRNKETAASVGSERGVVELSNSSALCCVMYHGGSQQ